MVLASPVQFQPGSDLFLLLAGVVCAFLLSYGLMFGARYLIRKANLIRPAEAGRKQDNVGRLGGVVMFFAFLISALLFYLRNPALYVSTGNNPNNELTMFWLFVAAAVVIVLVHAYDDVRPLKPWLKLLAQTLAVVIIMGPFFNGKFNGVLLFGFSNPFQDIAHLALEWYRQPVLTLFIDKPEISLLAIPAVFLTWFWTVGMMNTVNLIDGVDGLAGGVVAITGICITVISWMLQQYTIATLAGIFTGAVLGFLPHNWNPAKIFMGDSGSQFLGLGLAVLSIMGGAKVALALMVMGLPIMDVAVVLINRIRRGQSPLHYDTTHLHHRLRATGLSPRQICLVLYGLTAIFGILALNLFHIYKLLGIALVIVTMAVLIVWIDHRQRQRGMPIDLDKSQAGESRDPAFRQDQQLPPTGEPEMSDTTDEPGAEVAPGSPSRGSSGAHFRV
jgi:UDP-GlcNAc:undecaprenyl-phosphate GlcNAc-1-phosphate transferase